MRALARLLLVYGLVLVAPPSRGAERCTPEWATELARSGKNTSEDAARVTGEIGQCPNRRELLLAAGKTLTPVPERAEAPSSGVTVSRKKTPARNGSGPAAATTSKKPALPTATHPHPPSTSGPAPGAPPAVAPPADTAAMLVYAALLKELRDDLARGIRKLQTTCGGFKSCPAGDLRAWLGDLNEYLVLVRSERAPPTALQEAGDLIGTVAAQDDPSVRLAAVVSEAIARMTREQKAQAKKNLPKLEAALAADNEGQRLAALLDPDIELTTAYTSVVVAPSRIAIAGREVVVAYDLAQLHGQACEREVVAEWPVAITAKPRDGMRIYARRADIPAPTAELEVRLLETSSNDTSLCRGTSGKHCLSILVKTHFGPNAVLEKEPLEVVSPAVESCDELGQSELNRLVEQAFSSFLVESTAVDASISQAYLVRPGCATVVSKGKRAFADAFAREHAPERRAIYLGDNDARAWEGFGQELDVALAPHADVLGVVSPGGTQPARPGVSVRWAVKARAGSEIPSEVDLTLHWNGANGPPDAELAIVPKDSCSFTSLSFQRTVAAQTAYWVLDLAFHDSVRNAEAKNWAYSPLALVLAGLPQFVDGQPDNDLRGVIFAASDVALLTTATGLLLASANARSTYSHSGDPHDLDRANSLLHGGRWCAGLILVPRAVSFVW